MGLTCYQILGVIPPISMSELKSAYRRAAATHHPDRGGDNQMIVKVNDAYAQLKREIEGGIRYSSYDSQLADIYEQVARARDLMARARAAAQAAKASANPQPEPPQSEDLDLWTNYIDKLILYQALEDYKKGWVMYQLLESRTQPPIEAWAYLAEKLGYKKGWAYHQFAKWGK